MYRHRHNRTLAAWGGNWWPAFRQHAASLACWRGSTDSHLPYGLAHRAPLYFTIRLYLTRVAPTDLVGHPTRSVPHHLAFSDVFTHRLIMDYIDIPNFALLRHVTMIVRLKTEVTSSCCQPQVHPVKGCSSVEHRLSSCEQCIRTRLNKKYSDCDSELVDNRLPFKTRTAKSSKHFLILFILEINLKKTFT